MANLIRPAAVMDDLVSPSPPLTAIYHMPPLVEACLPAPYLSRNSRLPVGEAREVRYYGSLLRSPCYWEAARPTRPFSFQ
jgi:hypothetical protein